MKHIVITGSTRGIGFGLAESFLARGCSVTISGRGQTAVGEAVQKLAAQYNPNNILGQACDVRQMDEVEGPWDAAAAEFGKVDIWINNAGYSGPQELLWKISPAQAKDVLDTNILGVVYGCMVAIKGMQMQGFGGIYNMEGMGSDGRKHEGLTMYGTSKAALRYFNESLAQEAQDTALIIGALSPGMVITDLVLDQFEGRPQEWERAKRIFNIIADRAEVVTPWLAEQMLANQKSGARIAWLTKWRMFKRMLLLPFSKRNLFDD